MSLTHSRPLSTHASPGDSHLLTGKSWLSLLWDHCFSLLCPGVHKALFVPPKNLCPVLWQFCNQIALTFKVRFSGDSQSLCQIPRLGSLTQGSEPSQQWENSLVLLFSSLWVTHLEGMGFDLIVVAPLLPSHCGYFVFGLGVSFLSVPASFC